MEKIILVGRLAADAKETEIKGKKCLIFRIRKQDKKNKSVYRDYTCFMYSNYIHRQKYLVKDQRVSVVGNFVPSIYKKEDGDLQLNLTVNIYDFELED